MATKKKVSIDLQPCCGNCARTLIEEKQLICYCLPPVILQDVNGDDYSTRGAVVLERDPPCVYHIERMHS